MPALAIQNGCAAHSFAFSVNHLKPCAALRELEQLTSADRFLAASAYPLRVLV
jgi:hypothetical protein